MESVIESYERARYLETKNGIEETLTSKTPEEIKRRFAMRELVHLKGGFVIRLDNRSFPELLERVITECCEYENSI